MGALQLLPGEKEELHMHPAASTLIGRQVMVMGFAVWGGLLWQVFHSPWWTQHQASDWTAPWTWLWGTEGAAYLWTIGGLAAGGAIVCLPKGPWGPFRVTLGTALLLSVLVGTWGRSDPETWLPITTAIVTIPALGWLQARRLGTHYHVTNLRLVVRTAAPKRTERSVLYSDLVDLDARPSPFADTGTLIPITSPAAVKDGLRLPGVRPFERTKTLVELLAQRATASDYLKTEQGLDKQIAEALASLHRP